MGRLATTLAIGSLVALQVFSGSAGAADTRHLFVGSDPTANELTNGQLTLSAVTVSGVSIAPVHVENVDNQTLNHVVVTFVGILLVVTRVVAGADTVKRRQVRVRHQLPHTKQLLHGRKGNEKYCNNDGDRSVANHD